MSEALKIRLCDLVSRSFDTTAFCTQFTCEEINLTVLGDRIINCRAMEQLSLSSRAILVAILVLLSLLSKELDEISAEYDIDARFPLSPGSEDFAVRFHAGMRLFLVFSVFSVHKCLFAAYHLAYIVYEAADTFEKETFRAYPLSIALYNLLLQLPFIEHRRGKWYKRLCIDFEHLKLPSAALTAAQRGLRDVNILVNIAVCCFCLVLTPCLSAIR